MPTNPHIYEGDYRKPSYESYEIGPIPDRPDRPDRPNRPNADQVAVNPMQTFKPPVSDFLPPSELNAPLRADGYLPPSDPTRGYEPPNKDYLPPDLRDDPRIPEPPIPDELPVDIDDGLDEGAGRLPSRGPQFRPLQQREKEKEYDKPPPRPSGLNPNIEDVMNSQMVPPTDTGKDPYIPKKTKFDIPQNFVHPDDADNDPDNDVDEFGTIDILDAQDLPEPPLPGAVPEQLTEQPFLGLAKLIDPDRKKSLKELEELREEVKKLAKLVEKPHREPQLPPMPTLPSLLSLQQNLQPTVQQSLPPQPSSFVPFLEKLEPSVLQQLKSSVRSQNTKDGKIPGKPGVDYPDFKTIPATDFSCENFLLEGFYADTFTSCQVNLQ